MGCQCRDIEIGSHKANVTLPTPVHMKGRSYGCLEIRDTVSVDRCLADEIQDLWKEGVITTGCCCGHNKRQGYIGVAKESRYKMTELGYSETEGGFLPKSV